MRKYFSELIQIPLLISGLVAGTALAATDSVIPTSAAAPPSHTWITFLSEGPIDWFTHDAIAPVQGKAYRVVITTSETYDTIYIESATYGSESCCKQIKSVKKFDLDAFCKTFGFVGEQSGFTFVRWLDKTSFVFRYKDRSFVMSDIDKDQVHVGPYSGT